MLLYIVGNTVLDVQLQDWQGNNRAANYKYFAVGDNTSKYRLQVWYRGL